MNARERANLLAAEGKNCGQSVLLAFADELGFDAEELRKFTSAFGCGMCSGNLCGAVSASSMVLSYLYKGDTNRTWDSLEELMQDFKADQGSILCKDILGYNIAEGDNYEKALREEAFLHKCRPAICLAAELLEKYVEEEKRK